MPSGRVIVTERLIKRQHERVILPNLVVCVCVCVHVCPGLMLCYSPCLQILCNWGWGFTRTDLLNLVQEFVIANDHPTPFKNGRPGRKWFNRFMRDHPELTIRKSEQFPDARAKATSDPAILTGWFALLEKEIVKADCMNKPENIYNVDETGFITDPAAGKVLSRTGSKNVYQNTGGSGREQITVCITGNAAGQTLPPYVVYEGKHLYGSWCVGGPDGARYAVSDHGWMERVIFEDYFLHLFLKESEKWSNLAFPWILIFDRHSSHISLNLALKAKENNVVLLRLPSHLTHILQPLDRAVFGELKRQWRTKLRGHSRDKIRKEDFPSKLKAVLEIGLKGENLKSGFKSTGIYPYCPDRVMTEEYTPFTAEDGQQQLQPLAETMTGSDTPCGHYHVVTPSPPHPAEQTLSFPGEPCTTTVSPTTHPCSISVDKESMSQIILSVETVPGSNILNITSIEIAKPANAEMSQPQPSTSATSSSPPSSSIKDYFLQHIMPTKKSNVAKRQRLNTLKYGESLTSEDALLHLEESERKKAAKKKQSKGWQDQ